MPLKSFVFRTRLQQWLLLSALLLGMGALLGAGLYREYRLIHATELDRLRTQVRVMDQNLSRQMHATDLALQRVVRDLPFWRRGSGYAPDATSRLIALEEALTGVRTVLITDVHGMILVSSRVELHGVDVSAREYFRKAREDADPRRAYVSEPFRTVLGVYAMNLTRAIVGRDGKFAGVVSATLDPGYVSTLLDSVRYAPDMLLTLTHGSGRVFLVSPHNEAFSGESLATPGSFFTRHRESRQEESVFEGMARLTGVVRITAQRTLRPVQPVFDQPLVLAASRDRQKVFAGWYESLRLQLMVYLTVGLAAALGLWLWQRAALKLVAEREAARSELEFSHQRYEQMSRTVPCALYEWSPGEAPEGVLRDGRFRYASPRFADLLQVPPEAVQADAGRLWRQIDPEDLERVRGEIEAATRLGAAFRTEFRMTPAGGHTRWIEIAAQPWWGGADDARLWQGFFLDITERKAAELELRRLATTDALTGVANRGSFIERFRLELDRVRRFRMPAAFLMLDIDHFKQVNDLWGHAVGDEVLRHLSDLSESSLRRVDLYGRIGGEEFGILLPGTDMAGALEFAERLRQSVQDTPAMTASGPVGITISIGVAELTEADPDTDTVMARADAALYEAKNSGRNRVAARTAEVAPDASQPT